MSDLETIANKLADALEANDRLAGQAEVARLERIQQISTIRETLRNTRAALEAVTAHVDHIATMLYELESIVCPRTIPPVPPSLLPKELDEPPNNRETESSGSPNG